MVDYTKPLGPMNHVCPQLIIKEKVQEDDIPPVMVCSHCILSFFDNSVEGILGDLETPLSVSSIRNKEGDYLISHWVVPIT